MKRLAVLLVLALLGDPAFAGSPVTINNAANTDSAAVSAHAVHTICDSGCSTLSGSTKVSTTALAANLVVVASAKSLQSFEVQADSTLSGAAWWIMIYDATTAPADGAVTPAKCYAIPSGTTQAGASFNTGGVAFTTGIVIGVSSSGCFSKTASTHAFISGDFQ